MTYSSYTGGSCNDVEDLSILGNLSWSDFASVPEALIKALSCSAPGQKENKDWSALVIDCDNGEAGTNALLLEQPYFNDSGVVYRFSRGYTSGYGEAVNPFNTPFENAQVSDPAIVPGKFGELMLASSGIQGLDVKCTVEVDSFVAGTTDVSSTFSGSIAGQFTLDGRFDFSRASRALNGDGEWVASSHRTAGDLQSLRDLVRGAEFGVAYRRSSPAWGSGTQDLLSLARHVYRWSFDPFEIPAFQALTLEESAGPAEHLIRVERILVIGGNSATTLRYLVDTSSPLGLLPVERQVIGSDGRVVEQTVYEDYCQLADGLVRPTSVVKTTYRSAPHPNFPVSRVRLSIATATELNVEQCAAVPADFAAQQLWMVWE